MEEGPYKAALRARIAGLPPLQKVMLDLDVALTGHEPEDVVKQYHHYPNDLEHWIRRDGWQFIWYLSDSGYSRVVWHEETGNLSLTSNSRQEVKDRWEAAAPQRQAVANEMKRQWASLGGSLGEGWAPDQLGKFHTKTFNKADRELKRSNPCQVTKDPQGRTICLACRDHPKYDPKQWLAVPPDELCCGGCEHHGPEGCTAEEPTTCKTWLCPNAADAAPEADKRLRKVGRNLVKHNMYRFRGDRASVFRQLGVPYTPKLEALHLAASLLEVFEPNPLQIAWARQFLSMMNEGSTWHVPATGQVYKISHKDKTLTLVSGSPDARNWHEMNKVLFAKVGYQVLDNPANAGEQSFAEAEDPKDFIQRHAPRPLPDGQYTVTVMFGPREVRDDAYVEKGWLYFQDAPHEIGGYIHQFMPNAGDDAFHAAVGVYTSEIEKAASEGYSTGIVPDGVAGMANFRIDYEGPVENWWSGADPDLQAEALCLAENVLHEAPEFKTLKKARRSLSPEEKQEAGDAPVWKANVNGKTWYVCNTHRCFQARPTLKGAVHAWHNGVEQSG